MQFSCRMTMKRKIIITSPHPPMLRLKSQVFEGWNSRIKIALCHPNSLLLCDTIKIYFPPWPHPFSRQDEQSYSVGLWVFFLNLFESMCGLGFIYSMQFKLFTEYRIIHILMGFYITLITEIFSSKT